MHGVRKIEYTHYATISPHRDILLYYDAGATYNCTIIVVKRRRCVQTGKERRLIWLGAAFVDIYHRQGVRSFLMGRRSRRCLPRILVRALITIYIYTHTCDVYITCTTGGCTPSDWENRGGVRGQGGKEKKKEMSLWRKGEDLLILVFFFLLFFFFLKSVRRSAVPSETKQLSQKERYTAARRYSGTEWEAGGGGGGGGEWLMMRLPGCCCCCCCRRRRNRRRRRRRRQHRNCIVL